MAGDPAPGRRFDELTDPEIAAALARSPRVILPMGSIEQHGPHLPTGTDFFAATAIALEVAEHLDALVLPLCPLGVTPMHMPYPGTVSLRPGTLQDVVADIGSSLAAHGAREFVILNWHEGNIPALALAAEQLHREISLAVVVVQACYVAEERFGPRAGGLTHGGKIEAWSVLCCRPDLVHLDRAVGSGDRQRGELADRLRRDRSFQPVLTDVRTMSLTGWYGDPAGASELARSDVVTLHVPLVAATRGLIGEAGLRRMRPGAILVNASRGGVVDEAALAASLEDGRLGGAVVDVYTQEPPPSQSPLLSLSAAAADRVLYTPHIAGVAYEAARRLYTEAWANVQRVLVEGLAPDNQIRSA